MDKVPIALVRKVFTPSSPATLTFVERDSINNRLVDALMTPGKQLVIFGHSGSGKSTLLHNKLKQLYEDHITTRCMVGMTFDQLLLDAFDRLDKYFVAEQAQTREFSIEPSLEAEYLGIKAKLGGTGSQETQSRQQRVVPPQLTAQRLAQFIGEARCCWVLEDFHKMPAVEKIKLSQLMKVFMDMAVDYPSLKAVAIGAVNTAREIVDFDHEMANRIAEVPVPLMTQTELAEVLKKGEEHLNILFSSKVKAGILRYSNGLASVCHQLALNSCVSAQISEKAEATTTIDDKNFESALNEYISNTSDSMKDDFDKALRQKHNQKHDGFRFILEALSESDDEDGMTRLDIIHSIRLKSRKYPSSSLTAQLNQLQRETRGAVIRCDPSSGKYSFANPFYRVYGLIRFSKHQRKKTNLDLLISEMQQLTLQIWESTTEQEESKE